MPADAPPQAKSFESRPEADLRFSSPRQGQGRRSSDSPPATLIELGRLAAQVDGLRTRCQAREIKRILPEEGLYIYPQDQERRGTTRQSQGRRSAHSVRYSRNSARRDFTTGCLFAWQGSWNHLDHRMDSTISRPWSQRRLTETRNVTSR